MARKIFILMSLGDRGFQWNGDVRRSPLFVKAILISDNTYFFIFNFVEVHHVYFSK